MNEQEPVAAVLQLCMTNYHRTLLAAADTAVGCRGRNARQVNEQEPLDAVFKLFMTSYHHMLLATSAQGTVTGLITLEDVMEEIVQVSTCTFQRQMQSEGHSRGYH